MFRHIPQWLLFAFGSAFFASLTAILGKLGVSHINSNLATLIRTVIILLVTAVIITSRHEWQKIDLSSNYDWVFLILSGVATGFSWLCYYRALQLGPAAKVAPIDKLSVAITILLSVWILKEQLTWSVVLGGSFIVIGSLIIAMC